MTGMQIESTPPSKATWDTCRVAGTRTAFLTLLTSSSYDLHKETLENLSISATISENGFTGTVQNSHFVGSIKGNFYGPNAKEIGAIIILAPVLGNLVVSGSYYESELAFTTIVISGSK